MDGNELYYTQNRTRRILIAEDELINREILGFMLKDDYEIIYSCDGAETMEKIRENADTLSLILLDVMMPVMTGIEVLKLLKDDQVLSRIPVIVTTSESRAEEESLTLGAVDFIAKPYPPEGVIKARIRRIIELYEDKGLIQSTYRDELTGVYNREYFFHFAEQFKNDNTDQEKMDAVIVDIHHFHLINERFGRAFGDESLQRLGKLLLELEKSTGGIAGRREKDTFMVFCLHREDYPKLLEELTSRMAEDGPQISRVWLRMGVYPDIDRDMDIEQCFDRAMTAADMVKDNFDRPLGFYDKALYEKQVYAERLISDFPTAIRENQFKVYYQPKFNVRGEDPVLVSAEALVRWIHPELGMISPGLFIPVFEENGLIRQLDAYVWRETARQIRQWKDKLDFSLAVSVNISRVDMYDEGLTQTLKGILDEYNLTGSDLLLEITESAYTKDTEQIIDMVNNLRSLGFQIEMDDFGTGYSSLHMLSSLPIDALKMDRQFIVDAFSENGNTHMLEVVIELADFLKVPVVAEGVENRQQLEKLKALGCDIVQGFLFSQPVPAGEFEKFIHQRKEALSRAASAWQENAPKEEEPEQTEDALSESTDTGSAKEDRDGLGGIQLKTATIIFAVLSLIAAVALLFSDLSVINGYHRMENASDKYIYAQMVVSDMESGSDYLTDRVRCFVVTGEINYLKDFIEEVEVTRRRDKAVESLESLLEGTQSSSAIENLNTALALSNELVDIENMAMRLTLESGDYDLEEIPESISSVALSPEDLTLSAQELKEKAETLVFDSNYMHYKDRIREQVHLCTQSLIRYYSQELDKASTQLAVLANIQTLLTVLFLLIILAILFMIMKMIRKPLTVMVKKMQKHEPIPPTGVEELRFVTRTYNRILKENEEARERLSHQASHDPLTGLFNRGAYDLLIESADTKHMSLLMIDVDNFKTVNDTYGHAVGDRVLKKVAEMLKSSFRSVDIICRIGGDEFVVIMTRVNSEMQQLVRDKIQKINDTLQHPEDDLPPVSISVGAAFSDRKNARGDIFTDADTALYRVKQAGRAGCEIF